MALIYERLTGDNYTASCRMSAKQKPLVTALTGGISHRGWLKWAFSSENGISAFN